MKLKLESDQPYSAGIGRVGHAVVPIESAWTVYWISVFGAPPVPAPTTAILMGLGLMGIAARRRPGR